MCKFVECCSSIGQGSFLSVRIAAQTVYTCRQPNSPWSMVKWLECRMICNHRVIGSNPAKLTAADFTMTRISIVV